ncbi:MBL fold metallo-hydrolase [Plantactinospora sp. B6F1]|uniref:MBL fold metallo-hydrolase n=1 Tax=Plantactinospora sp. B6F1 TaxID=3158971 RepID=UPI0032D979BD
MSNSRHPIARRTFLLAATALGVGASQFGSQTAASATSTVAGLGHTTAGTRHGHTATAIRSVGGFDVMALYDAAGSFFTTRQTAFPTATPADWKAAADLDPAAFGPNDEWNLDFRCYAIRRPGGRVILVDTGVGPVGSPASSWAPVPGHLPERLAEAGIEVNDVDMVVLTHVHSDHIGWSVLPDGTPVFPNARYVLQRNEVMALEAGDPALLSYVVEPLRRTGQLWEVRGAASLVGRSNGPAGRAGTRVRVVPTPGHTPGHQSVLVEHSRRQIAITGDVLVHAVQLVNPDVGYLYEDDQDSARRSRKALLAEAGSRRALLATAHLKQPFVRAAPHRHRSDSVARGTRRTGGGPD